MKIRELEFLSRLLGKLKTQPLSVGAIKSLLKLTKELESSGKSFYEVQNKILEDYKVQPNEQGIVNWKGHKKEAEISKKINELNASDYDIQPLNFIDENEFFEAAKGMTIQEISFLEGLLVKKEVK